MKSPSRPKTPQKKMLESKKNSLKRKLEEQGNKERSVKELNRLCKKYKKVLHEIETFLQSNKDMIEMWNMLKD